MEFLRKHKRTMLLGFVDAAAIVFSCLLSYFIITFLSEIEYQVLVINLETVNTMIHSAGFTLCCLFGMWICGVYRNIWRYASVKDFAKCIWGIFAGGALYYAVRLISGSSTSDIFIYVSALLNASSRFPAVSTNLFSLSVPEHPLLMVHVISLNPNDS